MTWRKCEDYLLDLWSSVRGPYILLGLLVFHIFFSPLLVGHGVALRALMEILFLLILVVGAFTISLSRSVKIITLGFVILALAARSLRLFNQAHPTIAIIDNALTALALIMFAIMLIRQFIIQEVQLKPCIAASVAVYLLFGLLWGRLYEIVFLLDPEAFSTSDANLDAFSFIYFSFVTLVTIGYGDIVPVNPLARNLAILEGVIGQLYLVILISSFVSDLSISTKKAAKIGACENSVKPKKGGEQ